MNNNPWLNDAGYENKLTPLSELTVENKETGFTGEGLKDEKRLVARGFKWDGVQTGRFDPKKDFRDLHTPEYPAPGTSASVPYVYKKHDKEARDDFLSRKGRFRISQETIHCGDLNAVQAILNNMFIISAVDSPLSEHIDYVACSNLFKPVALGQEIPFYLIWP